MLGEINKRGIGDSVEAFPRRRIGTRPPATAFGLSLPGVPARTHISALALACHRRKPGEGGRSDSC